MQRIGFSYKQRPVTDRYDTIVIGSGIGGLAAAALLAKHGDQRVLVLEKHYAAGGFTHVFRRPGYEWDTGVHYLGRVLHPESDARLVFDEVTDGKLAWHPMPHVYDRIRIAGKDYDFPTGLENFRARLKSYFPDETGAIDRYLALVEATRAASFLYFAEKALPTVVQPLIGPVMQWPFHRYSDPTTAEVLGRLTRNRELIGVLTGQWGDYGLPPGQSSFAMQALLAYTFLEGGAYPVGGGSAIAAAIAPVIEAAGGRIATSALVREILVEGRRAVGVRMADGRTLRSRTIISNAGARNTFVRLLPRELTAKLGVLEQLDQVPPSTAHLGLYVGLKGEARELELDGTNLWVYPGPDHDANVARSRTDPSAPFAVLFVSFPSAKDPTFGRRYPGRSTVEVVTLVPHEWFAQWQDAPRKQRGDGYQRFKEQLRQRLQSELETHVPALRGRIDHSELSTPLSTAHFANYAQGEIYGSSAVPARFRLPVFGVRTGLKGLFLTGQDACTTGVSGGLFGGVLCASAVLSRNLLGAITRARGGRRAPSRPAWVQKIGQLAMALTRGWLPSGPVSS